ERLESTVVPVEGQRGHVVARGELELDMRRHREAVAIEGRRHRFDARRVAELEREEREVHRVARHIAEGARAEIPPASPAEGQVGVVVRTFRGRPEPEVPVEALRDLVLLLRALHSLIPDWTIRPNVDLANLADAAGLDDFRGAAKTLVRGALVPHLGGDLVLRRRLAHDARLVDRVRE